MSSHMASFAASCPAWTPAARARAHSSQAPSPEPWPCRPPPALALEVKGERSRCVGAPEQASESGTPGTTQGGGGEASAVGRRRLTAWGCACESVGRSQGGLSRSALSSSSPRMAAGGGALGPDPRGRPEPCRACGHLAGRMQRPVPSTEPGSRPASFQTSFRLCLCSFPRSWTHTTPTPQSGERTSAWWSPACCPRCRQHPRAPQER